MGDYLTSAQIEDKMKQLAEAFSSLCTRTVLPNKTNSDGGVSTSYSHIKIGSGGGPGRKAVMIVAGMHARELAQPDAVLSFAEKLLNAYQSNSAFVIPSYTDAGGATFGPVSMAADRVKQAVDTLDMLMLPLANPDGRTYCLNGHKGWRKNLAAPAVAGDPTTIGVDINRNFDIAWDYKLYYSAAAAAVARVSDDPKNELYHGAPSSPGSHSPALQPEVQNIIAMFTGSPVTFFIDLHSYALKVMYPWGLEKNGSDPSQTFQNSAFDNQRDGALGDAYSEFFTNTAPDRLLDRHKLIAQSMVDGIQLATGRKYDSGAVGEILYPSTGSGHDWVFSRQLVTGGATPVHSFVVEFGDAGDRYQPLHDDPQGYPKIEREVHAVLLRFLDAALPPVVPGTGSGGGAGGDGSSACLFSIAAAELALGEAWLTALRGARGALLGGALSRGPMLALDRAYRAASRRLGPWLQRHRWARQLVARTVLAPAGALAAAALAGSRRS
jgi:hypothetical protein